MRKGKRSHATTLEPSSSDLSSALSDVPEDLDADVIIEQTVIEAVEESANTTRRYTKRQNKRAAEEAKDPVKRINSAAERIQPESNKNLTDIGTNPGLVKTPPKKRSKRPHAETNNYAASNLDVEAERDIDGTTAENTPKKTRKRARIKQEVKPDSEAEPLEQEAAISKPKRKRKVKAEDGEVDEQRAEDGTVAEKKVERKKKPKVEYDAAGEEQQTEDGTVVRKKRKRKTKEENDAVAEEQQAEDGTVVKKKRRRKTKEEKEAEAMPVAARTIGCRMFIGAHVSAAGGVHNAVTNCVHIGGNAFALFLKSQRKWESPAIKDEHLTLFHTNCTTHSYDSAQHILPHGSYLVNLAQHDATRHHQAYTAFLDDLQRCEALGIKLFNFHPGSTVSQPRPEAIARIADSLNRAHSETKSVITLLETMARRDSNCIGSSFEDLRDIIALVTNKSRVGVCFDTCHAFAAGYDLRSPAAFQETMRTFDEIVGMQYLKALHLNDSKAPLASGRDLHANIGTGFLGLRAFHNVMNEKRFWGLPMVLETPIDVTDERGNKVKGENGKEVQDTRIWAREIKMLESFVDLEVGDEAFLALESRLAVKGEGERKRIEGQVERRNEKLEKKKAAKGRKGRQRGDGEGDGGEDGGEEEAIRRESESELSSLGSSGDEGLSA